MSTAHAPGTAGLDMRIPTGEFSPPPPSTRHPTSTSPIIACNPRPHGLPPSTSPSSRSPSRTPASTPGARYLLPHYSRSRTPCPAFLLLALSHARSPTSPYLRHPHGGVRQYRAESSPPILALVYARRPTPVLSSAIKPHPADPALSRSDPRSATLCLALSPNRTPDSTPTRLRHHRLHCPHGGVRSRRFYAGPPARLARLASARRQLPTASVAAPGPLRTVLTLCRRRPADEHLSIATSYASADAYQLATRRVQALVFTSARFAYYTYTVVIMIIYLSSSY